MSAASLKRTTPPRRREEARALFRNAILESAEQVFAEKGFHAARIQDIAERARIAVGTVYNHFDQKEDVLRALLDERTSELLFTLAPAPGDPDAFEPKLVARVTRMLRYIDEHRGFFAIALEHGLIGASSAAAASVLGSKRVLTMERFRKAFQALVDEGIAEGVLEPLPGTRLARFLGAAIRAFTFGNLDQEEPLETEAPVLVGLFLHGASRKSRRAPAKDSETRR